MNPFLPSPFIATPFSEVGGGPGHWEITGAIVSVLGFGYAVNDTFTFDTAVAGAPNATGIITAVAGDSLQTVAITNGGIFLTDPSEINVELINIIGSGLTGAVDVTATFIP